ncbi:hypothetical protein GCM10027258_63020 [Amycolatopsis stemonae]
MTATMSTEDTSTKGDADAKDAPPDFAATLLGIGQGRAHRELSEQMAALVTAVEQTKKGGSLTLTINVKPQKNLGIANAMLVTASVGTKLPKFDQQGSIFYATEDGGLARNPGNQQELPGL